MPLGGGPPKDSEPISILKGSPGIDAGDGSPSGHNVQFKMPMMDAFKDFDKYSR